MSRAAISIEALYKIFPVGRKLWAGLRNSTASGAIEALQGVQLEVFPGEIFGLLGPNGAGKTTLLEILATLLLPTSGTAFICGWDVVREANRVRGRVGYCPSATESFYPRLSAWDNMKFFALLQDLPPRQAAERISAVLHWVGMEEGGTLAFQKHSQGRKQRLALARALLTDPEVLLLDEPTKSLDPLLQVELWKFLREELATRHGKSVLLVTHSLTRPRPSATASRF